MRNFAISQSSSPYRGARLLLDGQQRLTSLAAVIRGKPVLVRGRARPIELLFNLDHPEQQVVVSEVEENGEDAGSEEMCSDAADASEDELLRRFNKMAFVVATRYLERLPQWVKVSEVFKTDDNAPFLKQADVSSFDDPRYEKYNKRLGRLRNIRKYVYRVDVLERTLSYDEVTEIFVRVNLLGAKLRSSDLALAQITAKWRGSRQTFLDFQEKCAQRGFEQDLGVHLKNMMALATGQSQFLTVGSLPQEALQRAWSDCCKAMDFALNFTRNNLGIDSLALLSSPFLLVVIGYLAHRRNYDISAQEAQQLRYWALVANAKGRFSRGSSGTYLDQDLAAIRTDGANELISRLQAQFGRLDITPEELQGRNQRSALFKTMFLAFRAAGAKDWRSSVKIALDHSGSQHRLQFHHIFPKAVLEKCGYETREADDIANLAFIGGKTNRVIGDKAPVDYLLPLLAQPG